MKKPGKPLLTGIIGILCLCCSLQGRSQNALFLSEGKIEYERTVNVYAQMKDIGNDEVQDFIKKLSSKFQTNYYDLVFSNNKTLYKPGRENEDNNKAFWGESPGLDNVVYNDMDTRQGVSQKKVFEQLFNVQDSLRSIHWKLTDETKVIAGFNCRRANAVIMDSIYVVAFYTEEILTQGGPESFTGLPGMILGVALPHQHITWFATKVQSTPIKETEIAIPQKGKKTNNADLKEVLDKSTKQWGRWAQRSKEAFLL